MGNSLPCTDGLAAQVGLAILQEDLSTLLEECEQYLFSLESVDPQQLNSFEDRSFTVLEEVRKFVAVYPCTLLPPSFIGERPSLHH